MGLRDSRSNLIQSPSHQRLSLVRQLWQSAAAAPRTATAAAQTTLCCGGYKGKVRNAGLGSTLAVTHGQASTFHYNNNNSDGCYTMLCCLGNKGSEWDNLLGARGDKEGGGQGIFQMPKLGISTPF